MYFSALFGMLGVHFGVGGVVITVALKAQVMKTSLCVLVCNGMGSM